MNDIDDHMARFNALHNKILEIEDELEKKGMRVPKRCHSCAVVLTGNETYFCNECKTIMEKELAAGNVYLGGNVKRPTKIVHYKDPLQ